MRIQVGDMVNRLAPLAIPVAPSHASSARDESLQLDNTSVKADSAFIVICPTEIISLIDTLCPLPGIPSTGGWDPFLASAASAFHNQYARTSTTSRTSFDQLRRELAAFSEQSFTSRLPHPSLEKWTVLFVNAAKKLDIESWTPTGTLNHPELSLRQCFPDMDATRNAAVRLASEYRKSYRDASRQARDGSEVSTITRDKLLDLFEDEYRYAHNRSDKVDARYWHGALKHLHDRYPVSGWAHNDTQALKLPIEISRETQRLTEMDITRRENKLLDLKDLYASRQGLATQVLARLDKLRNKLWYTVDVINSNLYEDAKNIASALNSIAGSLLSPSENTSEHSETASLAGSVLSQSSRETAGMLKAPSEHGGPKKLSDMQVDMIRKWLKRSNIENFCKGEERIHRFCMEIKVLAKKLAAENVNDSPVLWASELFAKEKALCFDTGSFLLGGIGGTRTPSVRSETMSSVYPSSRGASHGFESGLRIPSYDAHSSPGRKSSFHSLGSSRIRTDVHPADGSSLNGSPDRTYSSAASDTISSLASLWSPAVAQSQSATSISTRSRPPSTYNDIETAKLADQTAREKTKFLEELQQDLTCLLLSDLGCPVWSYGSETDAWLLSTGTDARVSRRIRQRHTSARLLSARELSDTPRESRRSSSSSRSAQIEAAAGSTHPSLPRTAGPFAYIEAYRTLLERCSQHVDPVEKLQALYDMRLLVVAEMEDSHSTDSLRTPPALARPSSSSRSAPSSRRSSFDPSKPLNEQQNPPSKTLSSAHGNGSMNIVAVLQAILEKLKPKTLFRDLQYISVFVQQEILNKTERGKALTDFGLTALAYKADIAQAMVDVADGMLSGGSIKHSSKPESSLLDSRYMEASTFLLIAAREGHAVAQREVAGLYLSHPEMKQVISLPLSFSGETFKKENEWQKKGSHESISSQAMCLALHWMQQAASNGDRMAKEKLKKRDESDSIL